jgi:hypothetical protein
MNNLEKFLNFIHFVLVLSVLLLPFVPNKYLIYILPYPVIYQIIWLIFDGCPLTIFTHKKNINLNRYYLNKFFNIKLNEHKGVIITNLTLTLIIVISAYKLLYYCKY